MKSRLYIARLAAALLILELVLVFVSWLLSATVNEGVRPLLSSEGVRWLCGYFVDTLLSPVLVWLLVGAMAWGCLVGSRLPWAFGNSGSYRQRFALRATMVLLLLFVGLMIWLSAIPHALLLSVTGDLWPSPFSRALVPLVSLGIILLSSCYGLLSHSFTSLADVTDAITQGLSKAAPLLLLYVLSMQLYESLCFVFL